MADIVDVFLVCWCALALCVYVLGQIYEKQLEARQPVAGKASAAAAGRPDTTNLDADFWAAGGAQAARVSNASHHYGQSRRSADYASNYAAGPYASASIPSQPQPFGANAYEQGRDYVAAPAAAGRLQYASADFNRSNPAAQQQQQASRHYDGSAPNSTGLARAFASGAGDDELLLLGQQHQAAAASEPARPGAIPTATGFNSDCVEWVNSILFLFYTQPHKYGPVIAENVYRSLNEKLTNITSSSSEHAGLLIEFEGVHSERSSAPELTNVRTECESDRSVSVVCKIYNKRLVLNLLIRQLLGKAPRGSVGGEQLERRYELSLENLEGKLKSMAILGDKLLVLQFLEKPDTKILLRPISAGPQLINEDVLVQMILQTLTQVVVDLYFGNDPEFPQYKQSAAAAAQPHQSAYASYKHKINSIFKGSASELKRSLKQELFGSLTATPTSSEQQQQQQQALGKERKVFVKILRAKNINYNQNVTCLLELDAPKQQALSSTKPGNSSPFWDEHFLFGVGEKSRWLTFELWDSLNLAAVEWAPAAAGGASSGGSLLARGQKQARGGGARWNGAELTAGGAKFLGAARVSIDELRLEPVQRLSLTLQPASGTPNDLSNSVGGELQLELLFLEHNSSPTAAAAANSQAGGPLARSSSGPALHKWGSASSLAYHPGDIVSIDRKLTPSGYVITTTTITKPAAAVKQQQARAQDQLLLVRRPQSPAGSSSQAATEHSFEGAEQLEGGALEHHPASNQRGEGESPSAGRLSRSRSRSRSFLRALRKRFSFSRTRSRSVGAADHFRPESSSANYDEDYNEDDDERAAAAVAALAGDQTSARLGSGRRSRASSDASSALDLATGRARSVPAQASGRAGLGRGSQAGGGAELPTIVINRSRMSADTAASALAFAQPKSQLVIEVLEPTLRADGNGNHAPGSNKGIYRYYAISDNPASQRKWRKRGTKLHLFNEHQFVAAHLASSSTCHLCGRVFSRRPGKQGYKCRNCHLLLHKQCHVKVDHNCPYATRQGLQLEYIDADPPGSLLDELLATRAGSNKENNSASTAAGAAASGNSPSLTGSEGPWDEPYLARQMTPGRASVTRGRPQVGQRPMAKSISMEVDER